MIRIFLKSEKTDFRIMEERLGGWRNYIGDAIECLYQEIEDNPEYSYLKKTELIPFLRREFEESLHQLGLIQMAEMHREDSNKVLTLAVTNTIKPVTTLKSGSQNMNTTKVFPTNQRVDGGNRWIR